MSEFSWPGGSPEATLGIIALVTGLYVGATWIATIVWTLRDVTQRTRNVGAIMGASLLVTATFVFGLALYLIVRPRQTVRQRYERQLEEQVLMQELTRLHSCPACARPVQADYVACPACATNLKAQCRSCSRAIDHSWVACPYCAEREPVPAGASMRPQRTAERPATRKPAHAAEPAVAASSPRVEPPSIAAPSATPVAEPVAAAAAGGHSMGGRILQPANAMEITNDGGEAAGLRVAS